MPPRRRKRLGRIDAAIDAMSPLGFTVKQVRKCVKELLKEYGGDEGWPFIEDASYSELIAAILRDVEQDDQEEAAEDGNIIMQDQLKDKSIGEEELSVTHNRASDTERSPANTASVAEPLLDGKGWSDLSNQTSVTKNNETPRTKVDSLKNQSGRLLPCYGWIMDEDELKDKYNDEEEASMNAVALAESVVDGKGWKGIFSDQTSVVPVNKNKEEPPTKDKSINEEELSVTHNRASDTEKSPANTAAVAEPILDGKGWSDLSNQTSVTKNNETPRTKVDSSKNKSGRLLPCYGWITDDDELKDKYNDEEEASMNTVAVAESVVDGKGGKGIFSDQTSAVPVDKSNEEPPKKVRIGTGRPCYGWVEDNEEENVDDFITLQPSSMVLGPPKSDA